jgi:hypothetical protein
MNATFQVDPATARDFDAKLQQYLKLTSRTVEEAINFKMLFIAREALANTPATPRTKIESSLNVIGYELNKTKKGAIRKGKRARGAAIFGGALIYRIINARLGRKSKKGLHGAAMKAAAQTLLKSRFKSSGTLKAGFAGIVRVFAAKMKQAHGIIGLPGVKLKGKALPAEVSEKAFRMEATATYQVGAKEGKSDQWVIHPLVQKAVEQAFKNETAAMTTYIEDKLRINQPAANL